jgi:hypothetical protein
LIPRRALKVEASKVWLHAQDRQKTRFQLQSNALRRKIDAWKIKQQLYTPCVIALRNMEPQGSATPRPVYQIPLWLPSQIGFKSTFDKRLADIEWRLRVAQAYEFLDQMRNNLQIRAHLFRFKDRFVRGQTANTRARNAISTVQAHIDANVETYCAAYAALLSLGALLGKVGWQAKLQPLADSDVREISEGEDGFSEGRRKLSWIWKTLGVVDMEANDELCDALRVEWCKSRARAMRFTEEVELLQEEMTRVLRFLEWQEDWWRTKGQCEGWGPMSVLRTEALKGYAERQAALRRALRLGFSKMWRDIPQLVQLMHDGITNHTSSSSQPIPISSTGSHI